MKLLETLVLSQKPNYFQELFLPAEMQRETVMGLEVYRLEVDDDLAVLVYEVSMEEAVSADVLRHITPHLSAMLLLSDGEFDRFEEESRQLVDDLVREMEDIPLVIGIRSKDANLPPLPADLFDKGLYLAEKGRLFFWNPEDKPSQTRLLNQLWGSLQKVVIA